MSFSGSAPIFASLPHLRQRIDPRPPGRPACALARKSRSTLEASSAALAEPRSRRRHQLRGALPPLVHVPPHLIIGDPSPRHRPVLRNCRGHPDPESQTGHRACRQAVTLMDAAQLSLLIGPARRAQARLLSALTPGEQTLFLQLLDKLTHEFNKSTRVPLDPPRSRQSSTPGTRRSGIVRTEKTPRR